MSYIFITYGDQGYEAAKEKIIKEAQSTGEFQYIYAYGRENLSSRLLSSAIINMPRGGGLWSWKPDIIYSTMLKHQKGDVIVYCDAGCTLYRAREWKKIWNKLEKYDIIAQRIFQKTNQWTRKEIIDCFPENGNSWLSLCQFQATIIIVIISDFTLQFISEWRDFMIDNSLLAMDVNEDERKNQLPGFIENRHDQAIYSALVYKYLSQPKYRGKIYTQWEHIEDLDVFHRQAIRATRLRKGEPEGSILKIKKIIKRVIKDYVLKPFFYVPREWKNKN